jgi:Protein of unknown function (DUF3891)
VIVRPERDSLLFITQPDHAIVAADLADRCEGLDGHARREDIRLAVREHDNGWRELDEDLVFDSETGRALDFITTPEPLKQSVWPLGIDRLARQSAYAAALVAAHALFVYSAHRGNADWAPFFANQASRRDDLLAGARVPLADLERDYRFLALADLMSLSFCHLWTEPRERFGHTVLCEGTTLIVTPAIIPPTPFEIRVRARRLPDRPYGSAAELRATLASATPEWIGGVACGRDPA